ncbi:hypothetical protein C8T65DRAFT_741325 [Cerioporus squamosus]|nr:hypothetical protein C8T65DRAFT_741325 [Cerioporus squamosus]
MTYPFPTANATSQGLSGLSLTRGSTPVQQTASVPSMPTAPSTPVRLTAPPQEEDSPMSIDRMSRRSSRAQSPMEEILNSAVYATMVAAASSTNASVTSRDAPTITTDVPATTTTTTTDAPATITTTGMDAPATTTTSDTPETTTTDDGTALATPTTATRKIGLTHMLQGLRHAACVGTADLETVAQGFKAQTVSLTADVDVVRKETSALGALAIVLATDHGLPIPEELQRRA